MCKNIGENTWLFVSIAMHFYIRNYTILVYYVTIIQNALRINYIQQNIQKNGIANTTFTIPQYYIFERDTFYCSSIEEHFYRIHLPFSCFACSYFTLENIIYIEIYLPYTNVIKYSQLTKKLILLIIYLLCHSVLKHVCHTLLHIIRVFMF